MNATFTQAPNVNVPTLSSSAMLVELGISVWTARKRDKSATSDVLTRNNAGKAAGAFNKNLMADCAELVAIQKFAANARTLHYNSTLPWNDGGSRLLPTARYIRYHAEMTGMQAEFDRLVDDFMSVYDWHAAQMHLRLGALFNAAEYPPAAQVRNKFAFRLSYAPVPDAGDWRVNLGTEATEILREQYGAYYADQTKRAMDDLWTRLHEELSRFVKQLDVSEDGKKGKIFTGTIETVQNLADMLGECNFTGDAQMRAAHERLAASLAGVTREDLTTNEAFRADMKRDMEAALKALPTLDW